MALDEATRKRLIADTISNLEGASPGEAAVVGMLSVIAHQLEAIHAQQAKMLAQFGRVSAGGSAIAVEIEA
jgi:hypothetical protein